jgi:ABC-type transport system involved in multi-copper enzyme maturation permease subunit
MNLSRIYAVAFGAVYTLVGLLGFTVSTTLATANLIVFPVNLLHNLVHLLIGLLGLGAYFSGQTLAYARGMAVLFAFLTVAGFLPQPLLGLVPLGGADIPLHAATALLAAAAAWAYRPGPEGKPAAVRR